MALAALGTVGGVDGLILGVVCRVSVLRILATPTAVLPRSHCGVFLGTRG